MINFGSGSTVIKSKLIGRRMFILTAVKQLSFLEFLEGLYPANK